MSNDQISKALGEHFPHTAIKTRKGAGGMNLAYVEGETVIRRLNAATGNTWSLEIKEITSVQVGNESRFTARVALTIPGLGTREHIGVQSVNDRGGEDLVKGVVTDALKKAATLFGVGLELYGPDYEAGEIAPNAAVARSQPRSGDERPRMANPTGAASEKQIGFIKGLAHQKGIARERLDARCSQLYTKPLDQLTKADASDLIDRLNALPDAGQQSGDNDTGNDSDYDPVAMFNEAHPNPMFS